jgi:hypothetical protein
MGCNLRFNELQYFEMFMLRMNGPDTLYKVAHFDTSYVTNNAFYVVHETDHNLQSLFISTSVSNLPKGEAQVTSSEYRFWTSGASGFSQ